MWQQDALPPPSDAAGAHSAKVAYTVLGEPYLTELLLSRVAKRLESSPHTKLSALP